MINRKKKQFSCKKRLSDELIKARMWYTGDVLNLSLDCGFLLSITNKQQLITQKHSSTNFIENDVPLTGRQISERVSGSDQKWR